MTLFFIEFCIVWKYKKNEHLLFYTLKRDKAVFILNEIIILVANLGILENHYNL